jgi:hypothetical protein
MTTKSNIEFSIPNSKIQVPVPSGLSIEQIAQRYLGDSQRWLEIATLNFLQEPYIDNDGFQYPLLSNADGRNIVVGYNTDIFVGQTIYLYSSTQSPTARTILDIVTLSQTSFLLTLDGLPNLDGGISIPASVSNVNLVGLSKVDWLLNQYGDIVIDNQGDFQLAAGITNLVQALSIKFNTRAGTSLLNPTFGLSLAPGAMISDTSATTIYNQISNLITSDPRFTGLTGFQVNLSPPSAIINLSVQLAGIQGVFPISFQLPTSQL